MTRILTALLLALALTGCGSPGPADELGPALQELGSSGNATVPNTGLLYRILDSAGRAAVDARAAKLSAELGREVSPTEAVQFRGLALNAKVSEVEERDVTDQGATLRLTFESTGSAPRPAPLDLKVVKEGGEWRVSMPDLVAALTQASTPQPVAP